MDSTIPREFKVIDEEKDLRILQWNTLADALSVSTPTSNFCKVPQEYLAWDYRSKLVKDEIEKLDPDIVCLEEVDHYEDFFVPFLSNYEGVFASKQNSPCLNVPDNSGPDGIALFYRSSKFELREQITEYLTEENGEIGNQGFIVVVLEDKISNKLLICAVVHFKAKIGFEFRRLAQAKSCLEILNGCKRKYQGARMVWCGDFNGEPDEPFYELIEGFKLGFEDAYLQALGEHPPFSTWKIRPMYTEKRLIDYIWFTSSGFSVSSVLLPMDENRVPDTKFPSLNHPSDHILLCVDFKYT